MHLPTIGYTKLCFSLCVVAELSVVPTESSSVIPSVVRSTHPHRARHVHSPQYHLLSYSQ
jgi:hypothetical protein